MPHYFFIWADDNIEHIAENGLTQDDFELIVCNPISVGTSRTSGLPIAIGYTDDGRKAICVYRELGDDDIYPITAYEVE